MARSSKNSERTEAAERLLDSIFTFTPKTRQEIASESGLSLMTVGKTIDMLSEAGLLLTAKAPTDSPGRKPSATYPDPDYYYILIDTAQTPASVYVYDTAFGERTKLNIPKGFEYRAGCDRAEYINNLLMELASKFNYFKCIGAGLLLKDTEENTGIPFSQDEAKFEMSPFSVCLSTNCAAIKNVLRIRDTLHDGLMYYMNMSSPRFGIFFAGTNYHTASTGISGDIASLYDIETASSDRLAEILKDIRKLLKFDSMVIGTDAGANSSLLESLLKTSLPDLSVKCLTENKPMSHIGMLYMIRRGYMEKLTNRI